MKMSPDKPITRTTIAQIGCCSTNRKKKIKVSGKYELRNNVVRISAVGINDSPQFKVDVKNGLRHEYSREKTT
jgi:hypothetical protein